MNLSFNDIDEIIWGLKNNISDEVFRRWCQGFEFSENEPTALKQYYGGPCSILASVQAQIMKLVMFDDGVDKTDQYGLLIMSLAQILKKVSVEDKYIIAFVENDSNECERDFQYFKTVLKYSNQNSFEELQATLMSIQMILADKFGVLCYLYSIVATYGVEKLKAAMSDEATCLIDQCLGHSSQCLTNLLLTGRGTPYLFDNEKDLGGYIITGIVSQPEIGFLTIMEYLRYCEVGWNFKNPQYPIWILGSETHLTVLSSQDVNIIEKDNVLRNVEKIFNSIDKDDQGFIFFDKLSDFLKELNLETTEANIKQINDDVDPENLGILLKTKLLKYLYPNEVEAVNTSYKFPIVHYNGLVGSNKSGGVCFTTGEATVEDFTDLTKDYNVNDSQILKCLRTKWPTISLKWNNIDGNPSIN